MRATTKVTRFPLAAAVATAVASLLVAVAPAAGADTPWTPGTTHALPGATISVSGAGCTTGATPPKVYVYLNPGATEDIGSSTNTTIFPDGSGNWSGTLDVPLSFAPGAYTLWAQCVVSFNYTAVPFTVDDPAAPTTTTTTTTTTTVAPTTTVEATTTTAPPPSSTAPTGPTTTLPAALPAVAVAARPTFTG